MPTERHGIWAGNYNTVPLIWKVKRQKLAELNTIPDKQAGTFPVSIRVHSWLWEPLMGSFSRTRAAVRTCWVNSPGAWTLGKKRKANVHWENQSSHYTDQWNAYHLEQAKRREEQGVQRGWGERVHPINTGRIFLFIIIMTCQWNLVGKRKAVVAHFLCLVLETAGGGQR